MTHMDYRLWENSLLVHVVFVSDWMHMVLCCYNQGHHRQGQVRKYVPLHYRKGISRIPWSNNRILRAFAWLWNWSRYGSNFLHCSEHSQLLSHFCPRLREWPQCCTEIVLFTYYETFYFKELCLDCFKGCYAESRAWLGTHWTFTTRCVCLCVSKR